MAKLSAFKSGIKGLARPNRFLVSFNGSDTSGTKIFNFGGQGNRNEENDQFMVRSAQLPGKEIGDVSNLYWFGQNYKIGGDPTYADITLSFFNGVNFGLRQRFEEWHEKIADTVNNSRGAPNDYKVEMVLSQLGLNNDIIAQYYCHGVFPKNVSTIELTQDSDNEVEKFDVSFNIDNWTNKGSSGGATTERGVAYVKTLT